MPVVQFDHVVKEYASQDSVVCALDDVSLSVERGEFLSLVGRSGCGKTTLLNLAGAMDFPTSGIVLIEGQETSGRSDADLTQIRREQVGFVFQFFHLLPTLTAAENVELPLQLAGQTNVRDTALDSLRLVEMEAFANRYPHQLSGGEMQRVAIARSIVHSPRILLADEPIGNLDSTSADIVMLLLRRIADETDTAILMATHSLEAAQTTDSIVKLRDGSIEEHLKVS